jgi:hypothetical protein
VKRTSLILGLILIFALAFSNSLMAGTYSGGDGSEVSPYQIADINDLQELQNTSADWGDYFIQTDDIDASGTSGWDSGNGFSPIGNTTTAFSGEYDGNDYTISGLYINRDSTYQALFGETSPAATIKNLGVTSVDITSTATGWAYIAGLVARNYGTIQNCYTTGSVDSGGWYVGGLVGANEDGTIDKSYSSANVGADGPRLGGLVGENDGGTITLSYANGAVTGTSNQVGGLVGIQLNDDGTGASISNSHATAAVTGDTWVGGFIGWNESGTTITNSYSAGSVSGSSSVGGLVGQNNGSVNNSFWDTETSTQGSSAGGTGKTTSEMKTQSTFTDAGWDFDTIWEIVGGDGANYPRLQSNPDASLPVKLSTFTASAESGQIILHWVTQTEVNNVGFTVYRSKTKDGNYSEVAFIYGAGNSAMPIDYEFTDKSAESGKTYYYYLEDVDLEGNKEQSKIIRVVVPTNHKVVVPAETVRHIPTETCLLPNYPNPFNPETWIPYDLAKNAKVLIRIYNIEGKLVRQLDLGVQKAGRYLDRNKAVYWDGKDKFGDLVSSGLYFYILKADTFQAIRRMVLLK